MRHQRGHQAMREAHARLRHAEANCRRLRDPRAVPTRQLVPGTIALARVPFAEGTGEKVRPVLVVSVSRATVRCVPITTKRNRASAIEVEIGSGRRSWARSMVVSIDRVALLTVMGSLAESEFQAVLTVAGAGELVGCAGVPRGDGIHPVDVPNPSREVRVRAA